MKDRVNVIALPGVEDLRRDSSLFAEGVRDAECQRRIAIEMTRGLQPRDYELALGEKLAAIG